MYNKFEGKFPADSAAATARHLNEGQDELSRLYVTYGGRSYGGGIYRIFSGSDAEKWTEIVRNTFPKFQKFIGVFGFDWLGRVFALRGSDSGIYLFEPGTGEVLEVPESLSEFHEVELVNCSDAALASDFFEEWNGDGNRAPRYDECVGYKIPLFMGGKDELANLEIGNMEVYWSVVGQVLLKIQGKSD